MNRDRALEQVKAATFIGKNAAFLGCLLCGLKFEWSDKIKTACVSDTTFRWNPDWFDSLTKDERAFVLLHELWHIALLHSARLGSRDPQRWNIAADLRINADLINDGYIMPDSGLYLDQYNDSDYWSEERIYEEIPEGVDPQGWGTFIEQANPTEVMNQVSLVQQAATTAKMAGSDTSAVENLLREFLKPKLPWKHLLHKYLLEKLEPEYQWNKPNRRFRDIYLPSLLPQEGRLTSIAMFLDTSGSISDDEIKRFTSEVKFVQENLKPHKLIVVQFDTRIQEEKVYTESSQFKNISIKGYGGTSYEPVREYILLNKPTLSIIFTDLCATPMEPVGKNRVLWVVSWSKEDAPFGDTIHVD